MTEPSQPSAVKCAFINSREDHHASYKEKKKKVLNLEFNWIYQLFQNIWYKQIESRFFLILSLSSGLIWAEIW